MAAGALPAQSNVAEQYLLAAANQERAANGVAPLRVDPALTTAALAHAERMAANATISHHLPGEADLAERAAAAGARFSLVSENVAEAPTPVMIHEAWMHSAGHRENLLDPHVDAVGIAVVVRRRQLYAVQDFAHTTRRLSLAEQEATVGMLLDRAGVVVLPSTADGRGTCATNTGYAGANRPAFIFRYTSGELDRLPPGLTEKLAAGRYREAAVGACEDPDGGPFTGYRVAVLLYP